MSIEDLTTFFARLETDPGLQKAAKALQDVAEDERLAGLCRLAAAEGLSVTAEDVRSEAARPAAAALEDTELKEVVGGMFCLAPGRVSLAPRFGSGNERLA
jgi:predicted ribosomally synthesized peptide with nif11-like leader